MGDAQKNHLQAELARIEAEAARNSAHICAKAEALDAAHELCDILNKHGKFLFYLEPTTAYYADHCEILVYTSSGGLQAMLAAQEASIEMVFDHDRLTGKIFVCPAFPSVGVFIDPDYVLDFEKLHQVPA